jgi:hypothetical protein
MTTKRIYCCAFCNGNGHTINYCKDPKVNSLVEKAKDISSIEEGDSIFLLDQWLKTLSTVEIKVLGLQYNISLWLREKLLRETVFRVYSIIIENKKKGIELHSGIQDFVDSVHKQIKMEKEERKRKKNSTVNVEGEGDLQQQLQDRLRQVEEERLRQVEEERLRQVEEERLRQVEEERLRQVEEERLRQVEEDRLRQVEEDRLRQVEEERVRQREDRRSEREDRRMQREQYTYDVAFEIENDIMRIENLVLREFVMNNRNTVIHNAVRRFRYQQKNREPTFHIQIKKENATTELCDCPICYESVPSINTIKTNCKHSFCGDCIIKFIDKSSTLSELHCPMCREHITLFVAYDKDIMDKVSKWIVS